jgi:hypothetical protein
MVNYRLIYKIIGSLLFLLGSLLLICAGISFFYKEDDLVAFLISAIFTICCGFVMKYFGSTANNNLSRRDSYLLVTSTWLIFSFFGMLPFIISGYIPNVTDAFFETMSGFSTTGATILDDVEWLPHATLYWRTQTQWIGGLGIVFFTIAILPSMVGSGSVKVFAAEATGPLRSKMHPRLSTMAKWIWSIYLALTVACILAYYVAGMDVFDSINYAMTTTATGGFATHDASTGYFNNAAIDYTASYQDGDNVIEGNSNAIDLSRAHFEFYGENDIYPDTDNPDVENLDIWFKTSRTITSLHNRGFESYAIVIPPYDETAETIMTNHHWEGSYFFHFNEWNFDYDLADEDVWVIPDEWVLDAVNCCTEDSFYRNPFPAAFDAGWTHAGDYDRDPARFGKSVRRKTDAAGKMVDTNNSTNDFVPNCAPSLKK